MPRISELVEATARETGLEHALVNLYSRRLIDTGILPKGRGSLSAWAEPKHAAALLIALWATDRPNDGPTKVSMYSQSALGRLTEIVEWAADLEVRTLNLLLNGCEIQFEREPRESISVQWNTKLVKYKWQRELIAGPGSGRRIGVDCFSATETYYPEVEPAVPNDSKRVIRAVLLGEILCGVGAFFAGVEDFFEYDIYRERAKRGDYD